MVTVEYVVVHGPTKCWFREHDAFGEKKGNFTAASLREAVDKMCWMNDTEHGCFRYAMTGIKEQNCEST